MTPKDMLALFNDPAYRDAVWIRGLLKLNPGKVVRANCADKTEAEGISKHLTPKERSRTMLIYRYYKSWRILDS